MVKTETKQKRKWIIAYFDPYGEVYGPVWEIESKIKPMSWASRHLPESFHTYKVKEVDGFSEAGYKDSFVKSM